VAAESEKQVRIETVPFTSVVEELRRFPVFAASNFSTVYGVDEVELLHVPAGSAIAEPGESPITYSVILEGQLCAERPEQDGTKTTVGCAWAGEGYGETPLLHGKPSFTFWIRAIIDTVLVRFSEQQFWQLLACCPAIRTVVLRNMTERMQAYQVEALHREKLVTLGTLAAGLMHELHNPGAAAKRSAAHLRENLLTLQQIGLRMSERPKTMDQLDCMRKLLLRATKSCQFTTMSSVEQSDAEEAMCEWLSSAGVEHAYSIGPSLVEMGFTPKELECSQAYFEASSFSDALNWLGALVSSMSLVCAIEESIGRVSDLVSAVKKFAYDEKSPAKELDVHDSLQSTLTILGHKLRIKMIRVEKKFDASPSTIETRGSALSQVWTNLIDNAADASPSNGQIEIATWNEPEWLVVSISDHGSGIPDDVKPRIFEAFFTTKPQGSGTGLGLEIVHRIVTQKFGGRIDVESQPGETSFVVRLPRKSKAAAAVEAAPAALKA
jgi:signal transduction histidine kinase